MTTKDLRVQCKRHTKRESCFICGRHELITEAHHVLSLKRIKRYGEMGLLDQTQEPPIVWLCPNCHTYLHKFDQAESFRDEFQDDAEWQKFCGLFLEGVSLERKLLQEMKHG